MTCRRSLARPTSESGSGRYGERHADHVGWDCGHGREAAALAKGIVDWRSVCLLSTGQWFTVRPILQRAHGRVLFAGEHLADLQGFMEGAVNTGEAAADQL